MQPRLRIWRNATADAIDRVAPHVLPDYRRHLRRFRPELSLNVDGNVVAHILGAASGSELSVERSGNGLHYFSGHRRPLSTRQLEDLREALRRHAELTPASEPLFGLDTKGYKSSVATVPELYQAVFPDEVHVTNEVLQLHRNVARLRAEARLGNLLLTEARWLGSHGREVDAYRPF